MGELELLIVSHRRASLVTTHRHFADTKVCVPESQVADYAEFFERDVIVSHPDSVVGLCAKRHWVIQSFDDVAMLDDDSSGLTRVYRMPGSRRNTKLPADIATQVIRRTAETARELGAHLFGFPALANPRAYSGLKPFKFGGYANAGVMGVLGGSKLWFPETTLPVDDYWVCLLNAHEHRFAFYDMRYALSWPAEKERHGGMSEWRSPGSEVAGSRFLRRYFGEAVVKRTEHNKLRGKYQTADGERSIVIPWRQ